MTLLPLRAHNPERHAVAKIFFFFPFFFGGNESPYAKKNKAVQNKIESALPQIFFMLSPMTAKRCWKSANSPNDKFKLVGLRCEACFLSKKFQMASINCKQ